MPSPLGRSEDLEVGLLIEPRQTAVGSRGEQLVAQIHQDAVVAGGVIDDGALELRRHRGDVAGRLEQVIEAGGEVLFGNAVLLAVVERQVGRWRRTRP
ncbi:hypothetical protein WME91_13865 [Sorangium sp. So ce269]